LRLARGGSPHSAPLYEDGICPRRIGRAARGTNADISAGIYWNACQAAAVAAVACIRGYVIERIGVRVLQALDIGRVTPAR